MYSPILQTSFIDRLLARRRLQSDGRRLRPSVQGPATIGDDDREHAGTAFISAADSVYAVCCIVHVRAPGDTLTTNVTHNAVPWLTELRATTERSYTSATTGGT